MVDSIRSIVESFESPSATPRPPAGVDLRSLVESFDEPGGVATDRFAPILPAAQREKSLLDEFASGVSSGTDQLQSTLFAVARLIGRDVGIDALEDFGNRGIVRNVAEAQLSPVSVQGFSSIENMDDLFRWMASALGNALPSLTLAVSTGGIGGAIGSTLLKKGLEVGIRKTIQDQTFKALLRKGLNETAAKAAAKKVLNSEQGFRMLRDAIATKGGLTQAAIRQATVRGATRGVFAGSAPPQVGEAEIALGEAGVTSGSRGLTAIVAGVIGGILETLPALRLLDKMFPGVDKVVAKAFVKDFAKSMGVQAALEGSTEGAQEVIQLAALAYQDPSFDVSDPANRTQIIDAFAAGALVGAVTGGGAEVLGGTTRALRRRGARKAKATLPPFEFDPRAPEDPESVKDFVPADNTLFEEIKERVHSTVETTIQPAMNRITGTFQDGIDAVNRLAPGLNETVGKLTTRAKDAHEEFIKGHQHILDDTVRWAREQAAFITDQAQRLVGEERQAFIQESMDAVQTEVQDIAEVLRERGDQVADSLNIEVSEAGVFDPDVTPLDVESETEFVFGQTILRRDEGGNPVRRITQGGEAIGLKKRSSAEKLLKTLRERFPNAPESAFSVRESETDGTFTVAIDDSGQAETLREDQTVSEALDAAMLSARRNPEARRVASIQRKGVTRGGKPITGATLVDVKTLVDAGRKLDAGANRTLQQGFNAVVGRLLQRGTIDNESFAALQQTFKQVFPNVRAPIAGTSGIPAKQRTAALGAAVQETILETVNKQLDDEGLFPGSPRFDERFDELRSKAFLKASKQLARARRTSDKLAFESLPPIVKRAAQNLINEKLEDEGLKKGTKAYVKRFVELREAALARLDVQLKNIRDQEEGRTQLGDLIIERDEDGKLVQRRQIIDTEPDADDPFIRAGKLETEAQQARRQSSATDEKAPSSARPKPKKVVKPKPKKAKVKVSGVEKPTDRKGKPKKKAKPAFDGSKLGLTKKKVSVHLPGLNKALVKQIDILMQKVSNLLSDRIKVRIINTEAQVAMLAAGHPDMGVITHLRPGRFAVAWNTQNLSANTIYIMVDDFLDTGFSLGALLHEMGHVVHFDTWTSLSVANQDKLWKAFVKDVKSGRRGTGGELNMPGTETKTFPNAAVNIFEFREWMADNFVDWMLNRKQPQNAVERFFEAVGQKIELLYQMLVDNQQRFQFTVVDETFAEFVDAVAKGIKETDPAGRDIFFVNENAGGRSIQSLSIGTLTKLPGTPRGATTAEWNALKKHLTEEYPVIAARAKLITGWIHSAYHLALAPATSVMRTIGERVKAALKLASIFNREEHGVAKKSQNYHQRLKFMKGVFESQYKAITGNMTEADKVSLAKRLRELENTGGAPQTLREKAMRKMLDDMHDYLIEAGLPVGKIENYFPKILSREKMLANEAKILDHLTKVLTKTFKQLSQQQQAEQILQGKTPKFAARAIFNSMISTEADAAAAMREVQADEISMQSPSFKNMRSRAAQATFFDQFMEDNLDGVMANYTIAAIKRAEYNRLLGSRAPKGLVGGDSLPKKVWNPRGKFDAIVAEAESQGATEQDIQKMKNYVDANLGMFGRDDIGKLINKIQGRDKADPKGFKTAAKVRTAMAAVIAYQNMRVLLFTVFASLPDIVGPGIRSGDMRLAFRVAIKNIRGIIKSEGDLDTMARTFGTVSRTVNQSILTEYVDNHFMPPGIRKWNEAFFKWTGLNFYTDVTRKFALAVGIETIKAETNKLRDPRLTAKERNRAVQFLAELGLTPGDVKLWEASGERVWGGLGYEVVGQQAKIDEKVAEALIQFVDESIMSPNPSQRPILASHPAAMTVFHLKGFIYAIHDVILKRMAHNFNISDTPAQVLATIPPAILMIALTAFGLELRELVTRDKRSDRMDGWDYTWTLVERSGLLGISQLGFDFESAGERGQAELMALSGPSLQQLGDLISKPLSTTIPKAIPIASQLPWVRDTLRGDSKD